MTRELLIRKPASVTTPLGGSPFSAAERAVGSGLVVGQESSGIAQALFLRGATQAHVDIFVGFSEKQIAAARDVLNKSENDAGNSIAFAKMLAAQGYFGDGLGAWNALRLIYQEDMRPMPNSFFHKLALEAFLIARYELEVSGNDGPLVQYSDIGDSISGVWFGRSLGDEQDFVTTAFAKLYRKHKATAAMGTPQSEA